MPAVVAIGNFDGVHRGHAAVVKDAIADAKSAGLATKVLTFDPHPSAVVGSGPARPLLTSIERRAQLLLALGVDEVVVQGFDREFAAWSPERFAEQLLVSTLEARRVVVGNDFRFGANREGDLARLRELGAALGFDVHPHALVGDAEGPFSSSRARDAIARGDCAGAERVLGRPHGISGTVVHGQKLGRTLGFPTANLDAIPELLPPDGIYATLVGSGGGTGYGPGALSIGVRPTVGHALARTVEVYLLNDPGRELYGERLWVHLVERLRGEERFPSLEALKAQMRRDVEATRACIAARPPTPLGG